MCYNTAICDPKIGPDLMFEKTVMEYFIQESK